MAIDLYSTKQEKVPIWKKILFIFSIILLFIVLIIFSYNQFVKIPQNNKMINEVNMKLGEQGTTEQLAQKELVLDAEKRINEFKNIYAEKPVFDVYFNKFETWVYPRISFLSSIIDVSDAEISLKGQTDSLQSIMQEMLLLDAKNDILGYTISNIEMNNGKVTFNLNLKVNPELFKYQNEQQ